MEYDHRRHAGNAGDLWKHLVLAEVADHLFRTKKIWVYVESHVGYPEYRLSAGGEWEGGVGRCWFNREELAKYPYFQILSDFNPIGLERYPGSAGIVLKLAKRRGLALRAELWDSSPEVERAWSLREKGPDMPGPHFHLGDGFSGVGKLMSELDEPALLLVDSPYISEGDAERVEKLIFGSAEAGWVTLSWQTSDLEPSLNPACDFREFKLYFEEAGLACGSMKGATMILAWDAESFPDQKINDLIERLEGIEKDFPKIAGRMSESF